MNDLDHARLLAVMARKDFNAIEAMQDRQKFAEEIFGFHAQQAIEKGLKAWLASRSMAYPLRHDLDELFKLLEKQRVEVSQFRPLASFTEFAVDMRYEEVESTKPTLKRALVCSQIGAFLDHVEKLITPSGG